MCLAKSLSSTWEALRPIADDIIHAQGFAALELNS